MRVQSFPTIIYLKLGKSNLKEAKIYLLCMNREFRIDIEMPLASCLHFAVLVLSEFVARSVLDAVHFDVRVVRLQEVQKYHIICQRTVGIVALCANRL